MATVKVCDYPGCSCIDGVETFNFQGATTLADDFDSFDLCTCHQTLLIKWLVKHRDVEIIAHRILKERNVGVK